MRGMVFNISFVVFVVVNGMGQHHVSERQLPPWKELKYSMFIHYGIYSVLGGVWEGKEIHKGLSEQIQAHAGIYSDTYEEVAKQFNPQRWNADSIAVLAKSAGMRSIVITAKHHDGFCMFQSAYTDFDIVDATPFKRDIIQELSAACRRHGLNFGIYFSLIDWHYPQASPISSHNSDYITPEHHVYNKNQVTELLTKYGAISELWFDMGSQDLTQSRELRELVHKLQPNCQVSSRIGNDQGDFTVMGDNQEPDYRIGVPWQSPASFFDETWGYRSWQARGREDEKTKEKLSSLIRVVSRGGNYLLNIGPKPDGSVVDFETNVLLAIGKWLVKNGEAIYGTAPDPFEIAFDWGNITTSADRKKMYLLIRTLPAEGVIRLPGLHGEIKKIYGLSGGATAKFSAQKEGVVIQLPKDLKVADEFKVMVIEFKDQFAISPVHVVKEQDGKFFLHSQNAFKYYSSSCVDYNTRFRSTVKESWSLSPVASSTWVAPTLFFTENELGKNVMLTLGERREVVHLSDMDSVALESDPAVLEWSPMYVQGPLWSELERVHGEIENIDIGKPWPSASDGRWLQQTEWQNGKLNVYPATAMSAYYFLQEITSPKDQSIIVNVSYGDGVVAFLNGQESFIQLNQDRNKIAERLILLHLKKGKNQLLVKSFNNFRKEIVCSIDLHSRQLLYRKTLQALKFDGRVFPVSWQLANPDTPHQNIAMENVSLEFIRNVKR